MDKILIKDMLVRCIIGVNEEERHNKQDVVISIILYADLAEAGKTDDFTRTVDYKAVKERVVSLAEESSYFLVEALTEAIANACLEFDRVRNILFIEFCQLILTNIGKAILVKLKIKNEKPFHACLPASSPGHLLRMLPRLQAP